MVISSLLNRFKALSFLAPQILAAHSNKLPFEISGKTRGCVPTATVPESKSFFSISWIADNQLQDLMMSLQLYTYSASDHNLE
jgi:hypothetical protein